MLVLPVPRDLPVQRGALRPRGRIRTSPYWPRWDAEVTLVAATAEGAVLLLGTEGDRPMREAGSRTPREAAPSGGPSQADDAESRVAPARILVVDDEPAVRRFVTDALRSSGYEVVVASTGREALAAVYGESRTPTLLLTDIEMPGMSGVELAARIRADRPRIRVILMTGREASAARARERAGLVEGVLLKPFGLAELLRVVTDALAEPPGDPAA